MYSSIAKRAMTTKGQKACMVIDHLVEALGNDPSSSLRRAMILSDIDQYPGTTQVAIMERLHLNKSTVKREVDWLFDYGCIRLQECNADGRAKKIEVTGYSKKGLDAALGYFNGQHAFLNQFLEGNIRFLKQEKPTLRDAKIVATLYRLEGAEKSNVLSELQNTAPSTGNRAYNKLREDGVIKSDG